MWEKKWLRSRKIWAEEWLIIHHMICDDSDDLWAIGFGLADRLPSTDFSTLPYLLHAKNVRQILINHKYYWNLYTISTHNGKWARFTWFTRRRVLHTGHSLRTVISLLMHPVQKRWPQLVKETSWFSIRFEHNVHAIS